MEGLVALKLDHNPIAVLPARSLYSRLEVLHLGQTELEEIGPLAALPPTADLRLYPGRVCDLSPLEQAGIPVADLSAAQRCTCASRDLPRSPQGEDCSANNPMVAVALRSGAIQCPTELARVTELELPFGMESLRGLSCFPNLQVLAAEQGTIQDLSPLAALPHLRSLHLTRQAIDDLRPLAASRKLTVLELDSNQIEELAPIAGLAALQELGLADNRIRSLSGLGGLSALAQLDLRDNRLQEVAALRRFTGSVQLSGNAILDFAPLERAGATIDGREHQYRGSCLDLLRRGPSANPVFAVCPPWEDEAAEAALGFEIGCGRVERICDGFIGVDCGSAVDGPYTWYDRWTRAAIAHCGGQCISGCTNCPPEGMRCPTY